MTNHSDKTTNRQNNLPEYFYKVALYPDKVADYFGKLAEYFEKLTKKTPQPQSGRKMFDRIYFLIYFLPFKIDL